MKGESIFTSRCQNRLLKSDKGVDDTANFFQKSKAIHTLYRLEIQGRVWMILHFFENPEPSIMQNEKKSGRKSNTIHRGVRTKMEWPIVRILKSVEKMYAPSIYYCAAIPGCISAFPEIMPLSQLPQKLISC